jgi:hypothetical protein
MTTSSTLSSLHVSHSLIFRKVYIAMTLIGRILAAKPKHCCDLSLSLYPLL